ncbi:extracellular solute-binding protein [Clostridium hydrogenum]|uniref:extracellular solute-binding protein n=1 Tax=Clostridium hydrogenum TaxID=2855764 RepID=UPI002E3037E5|nr:extracellular solute-binding protein [Clostridium hydrogenum]
MIKRKSFLSVLLTGVMALSVFSGCQSNTSQTSSDGKIKEFSVFYATTGTELTKGNRVQNVIAKKIGAKLNETYLTGQTGKERVGVMIAGGNYTDFIDGGEATKALLDAHAFIPIDKYWDKYPNIKNFYSAGDWNKLRQPDGHIYYINQFGSVQGKDMKQDYGDEAFWLQKAVVKWAGYPKIKTLDQYFDVIEKYKAAHPTINGQPTIGFDILCDGQSNCGFCLENPPQFLAGYPNDGKAIIDPQTITAKSYDSIPEAKAYFKKLNEEYNKGIIDSQTFTASKDQYISKLSTGRVLGMVDQHWQFQTAEDALKQRNEDERTYVPFDLTIYPNVKAHYRSLPNVNAGSGIGITTSCKDLPGALKALNDLLSPEIETLRNWGEKGIDYEVDSKGVYYRTQKQRDEQRNQDWIHANLCTYANLPNYTGLQKDGINAMTPNDQPGEFQSTLTAIDKEVLKGYGYTKWTDFGPAPEKKNEPWFPIYSYVNTLAATDPAQIAYAKMDDVKKQWLPKVIIGKTSDFDSCWNQYQNELKTKADVKTYLASLTKEAKRRAKLFK